MLRHLQQELFRFLPTGRRFGCHLCLEDASEPALRYQPCELCERCHHYLTPAQAKRRFTSGLVQINTGDQRPSRPSGRNPSCALNAEPACAAAPATIKRVATPLYLHLMVQLSILSQ